MFGLKKENSVKEEKDSVKSTFNSYFYDGRDRDKIINVSVVPPDYYINFAIIDNEDKKKNGLSKKAKIAIDFGNKHPGGNNQLVFKPDEMETFIRKFAHMIRKEKSYSDIGAPGTIGIICSCRSEILVISYLEGTGRYQDYYYMTIFDSWNENNLISKVKNCYSHNISMVTEEACAFIQNIIKAIEFVDEKKNKQKRNLTLELFGNKSEQSVSN